MAGKVCYAITTGCYSDYGIDAVFLSKELAERALALIANNDDSDGYGARIEEFPLDDIESYEAAKRKYDEEVGWAREVKP
ncbi:MAG: hypothetical protein C0499_02365 [Zymomonas sp.]|nr:hypothetical protein [Zymomonas sp.]